MHDRQDSLAALRAENDRLAKENADLRKEAGREASRGAGGPAAAF